MIILGFLPKNKAVADLPRNTQTKDPSLKKREGLYVRSEANEKQDVWENFEDVGEAITFILGTLFNRTALVLVWRNMILKKACTRNFTRPLKFKIIIVQH